MNHLLLCSLIVILGSSPSIAAPGKLGKPICFGVDCEFQNVPIGSAQEEKKEGGLKPQPEQFKGDEKKADPANNNTIKSNKKRGVKQPDQVQKSTGQNREDLTNLPHYYQGLGINGETTDKVVWVGKPLVDTIKGLHPGDFLFAVVEQEIKASPSVPTPISATVVSGPLKGSKVFGYANLDRELKRILISFTRITLRNKSDSYTLKAQALSLKGAVGLEGHYVSHTGKFFIAELGAATMGAVVDSTIQRNQTNQGGYVQEPSLSNAAKSGAASALMKTADRMANEVKASPEYTEIPGYQEIQIILESDPVKIVPGS